MEKQLKHRLVTGRRSRHGPGRVMCTCLAFIASSGCLPRPLESRIDEAAVSVPGSWQATREAHKGVDSDWLRKTGGATLGRLVGEALAANPDLKQAAARVESAAAEARIAGAGRMPSLDAEGTARRAEQKFVGFPFGTPGAGVPGVLSNTFGVVLNAAWEVDVWGRMRSGQQAALADLEASRSDFQAARVSLAAQVAKAWLALAEANEQVRLAEEAVDARVQLAAAVRDRFERAIVEDGGSAAQVRLTEAEIASSQADLARRKQERDRAIRQLEILLGRYPSGNIVGAARLPAAPDVPPAGLPSELLLRRPDIIAAERRLAAAGGRTRSAKLARFPALRLTGSAGTTTDALGDIANSDFGIWSLGGSLTQPLFEGGRIAGETEFASARERQAAAELQRTVLHAFGEVENALSAEAYLREREAATARAAELARDAAIRAAEEFSAGTGDVLTMIETRQRDILSAIQHATVRRLRLDQRVDLHLALGGGFTL